MTINKLNLPEGLSKVFSDTNMIESAFSLTADLCHNVKRWRNANMAMRWAGTVLLETEKRFDRIKGYRSMALLLNALRRAIDTEQGIA